MNQRTNGSTIEGDEAHGWRTSERSPLAALVVLGVVCLVCLVAPQAALCDGTEWTYVFAQSERNDYRVSKGPAIVTIDDGKVKATMSLQHEEAFKLFGTLSKGKVQARFTIVGSEFWDVPFSGTYRVTHLKSPALDSVGRESIVLTDGYNVLALTREIVK